MSKPASNRQNVYTTFIIIIGAVNLVFTVIAIMTVDRLGRKPLMIIGSAGWYLHLCHWFCSIFSEHGYLVVSLYIRVYCIFRFITRACNLGAFIGDHPNRIRSIALSVAVTAQWISNFAVSQTFPMMMENESLLAHFHGGFPFWVYGAMCVISIWFNWKIVPETKGKTLEEMDYLWLKK